MTVKPRFTYHQYQKEISKYSDKIDIYQATTSTRSGHKKFRDTLVFGFNMLSEGKYYVALITDLSVLLGMVSLVCLATNLSTSFIYLIGLLYIIGCLTIGYVSYRILALPRRNKELDDMQSMSRYLTYDLLKQILVRLNELEVKINKRGGKQK